MNDLPARRERLSSLGMTRFFTATIMLVERLWRLLLPFLLLVCLFFISIWFGLFAFLPAMLHMGLLILFAVSGFGGLLLLLKLRLPTSDEIDRTLEKKNNLSFQPIATRSDKITHPSRATSATLWQEHQRRMQATLRDLRLVAPHPHIPAFDKHGLRGVIFLSAAVAFAYSFSPTSGKFDDIFFPIKHEATPALRVDSWVIPPDYTGHAPLYLKTSPQEGDGETTLSVPQNSLVHVQATGKGSHLLRLAVLRTHKAGQPREIVAAAAAPPPDITSYELPLTEDMRLVMTTPQAEKIWNFTALKDTPPHIEWAAEPRRAVNAMLELEYKIEDDYGALKAWAVIKPLAEDSTSDTQSSLYDAPEMTLTLPRQGVGEARTSKQFSDHPWAGTMIRLQLFTEDGAGHIAQSEEKVLTLPQRSFGNPLARAVVEQRRLLALAPSQQGRVLDMLSALLLRPHDTINNATHTIALQSAWTRLKQTKDRQGLRDVVDYMWDIALGLEGDGLTLAEQRLKQANQALRNALRDGANADEIERLMRELRQAMQDYMAALAAQEPARTAVDGERQTLDTSDFDKRLQEIEEMAQLGNRSAAEQLLAELEQMMDNLQILRSDAGEGGERTRQQNARQQNMDRLADLMRRQQDMLNETDRLNQAWNNGETDSDNYRRSLEALQQRQGDLRQDMEEFGQGLSELGMEQGEAFDEASQAMEEAQSALQQGDGEGAGNAESHALEAMRRGARSLMEQMREAMRQAGKGTGQGEEQGQGRSGQNGLDPLGRGLGNRGYAHERSDTLPDEMEIEKARRILDDIRNRLGIMTPEEERAYLERLLNFN